MSHKIPANLRNDMYVNLPAQAILNDSVRNSIKASDASILLNNQNSNRKPTLSKEMLYATPLRKSDRFKSREKVKTSSNSGVHHTSGIVDSDKINNTDAIARPTMEQTDSSVSCNNNGNTDTEHLGERRILSFLKDTTQLHKKMEMHRGFPSSNFSCLAREEHFANLVQQNVVNNDGRQGDGCAVDDSAATYDESMDTTKIDRLTNLESEMEKKLSPDKEVGDLICLNSTPPLLAPPRTDVHTNLIKPLTATTPAIISNINREWVLKKVAMCLEQRSSKKSISVAHASAATSIEAMPKMGGPVPGSLLKASLAQHPAHIGCIILGSNGSGKTTVCQSILDGNTGTRGILNRKLLGCYFVNSQNPECHNLSMFIRSLILQILSHSSYLSKEEVIGGGPPVPPQQATGECDVVENTNQDADKDDKNEKDNVAQPTTMEEEELLISELKLSEKVAEFCAKKSPTKGIIRQQSDPLTKPKSSNTSTGGAIIMNAFTTHPPLSSKSCDEGVDCDSVIDEIGDSKNRPKAKISKIPVKIGSKSPKRGDADCSTKADEECKETEVDVSEEQPKEEAEESVVVVETVESVEKSEEPVVNDEEPESIEPPPKEVVPPPKRPFELSATTPEGLPAPLPLPKTKSCRTAIADEYYEMLMSNPDIFESLYADNIEKNPDDCFKKSILFPLLELTPPRNALLLLIDSIDENYINEGNLMSTLKGRNSTKSRNIAELLSNHIHLFPKWLFLVCTAKKQNKHITKIFSGFKKITLDDLRKSHVVKDVQEYIINRLNTDFKGSINLSKEVIESLNQLYIKSNGCILYLQKVLNGIKENFFSFREIKLIPCTLNGLYLYICQKSFNKKQYTKIRPILNILLACNGYVETFFVLNCLRSHNYNIDVEEFDKRIEYMRNVLVFNGKKIKIFHNSFCDWLVDVKFSTKKFLCDVNEGHIMISMYYTLISETLCPNQVRRYIYHLIKAGEYLTGKNIDLDLILILLESKTNLSDCFYTNLLNCCNVCEDEYKNDVNFLPKTKEYIEKFLNNELNEDISSFLCDFFKPNLPTDAKTLKLLIETGINNADCQLSYESSQNSPVLTDKSQNIDSELAELLISSERSCQQEAAIQQQQGGLFSPSDIDQVGEDAKLSFGRHQLNDNHNMELHKGKALIHILANEGNHILLERALKACKDPIDLEIEDVSGQTALNIAARNGHIDIVQLLLNVKSLVADVGTASAAGNIKEVDVNHADRDGWTPLRSASWGGHTEVVKLLIEQPECAIDLADKEERTALRAAAWSGHEDILKILINAGANVNSVDKQSRTSLIAASYMGHYEIVEILLENGADVNHLDVDGRSALCVAALCGTSGYSKVISCLLEHGANTDQLDNDGMSPLLVSSFEGNTEVCELLLENGADPDLADFMGRTPLWAACTAGHAAVVKLLLFWGCGIDCMDSEGRTVLSIAAAQGIPYFDFIYLTFKLIFFVIMFR